MASNAFGKIFRITTWGESHGKAIGVVIDGCPAGIEITETEINAALARRAPGNRPYTSPRREPDQVEIYSGVYEGKTTGTPLSLIIPNKDSDSRHYEPLKEIYRPGHAHFTYLEKYGIYDYRGGGRASARETACRVAAGAIAQKILLGSGIRLFAYIKEIAGIEARIDLASDHLEAQIANSPLFCPDSSASEKMVEKLQAILASGDSVGGVVELWIPSLPAGLGDPVYEKLEASLASAFMSIPASKGVEIGEGFQAARMQGSAHNDRYVIEEGAVRTATNHAGGILGGISSGMPILARIAFKPPASIKQAQSTIDTSGRPIQLELPAGSRHDPCVAIRAVPVVEAMAALVLVDALLSQRCARL
jgi:chorismate synthase